MHMIRAPIQTSRFGLSILPILVVATFLYFDTESTILGLLSDDAFYYLKIAHSILDGHGSSFDGIAMTNGYHPLWMLCIIWIQHFTSGNLFVPVVASILLSGFVFGLTLSIFYRAVERWEAPAYGPLIVSFFFSPLLFGALTNGLETGILLLAIALFVWSSGRYKLLTPVAGASKRFMLGLLLGIIFLCRLDSAFMVLGAGALTLASGLVAKVPLGTLALRSLALIMGVLVLAVPFFAWNYSNFGHLSPISGLVKSSFPVLRSHLSLNGDMKIGLFLVMLNVLLALAVAGLDLRRGRGLADILSSPLSILTAGAIGHFTNAFLYMSWGVYWWHFVISGAALTLGVPQFCQRIEECWGGARPVLRYALPALVGIVGISIEIWICTDKLVRHREYYEAANWAHEHTPADAVFAMKDAGLFSYFSERHVINLDGKANSYEYLASIEKGDVRDYLRRFGVSYIANINASYAEGRAEVVIPRVNQPKLLLWMPLANEVYHSTPYPGLPFRFTTTSKSQLVIWSFHG